MCCSLYEDEMFTQMEWHVLQTLNWAIGHPSVDSFLQIAIAETPYDSEVEHMARYISELAFFHKEFVSTLPSVMARSALFLARCILSRPEAASSEWSAKSDPRVVNRLYLRLYQPSPVVSKKYAAPQLSAVSITVQIFVQRQSEFDRSRRPAHSNPVIVTHLDVAKPYLDAYSIPQTPPKPPFAATFSNGLYTPPITPDNDPNDVGIYDKYQVSIPRTCPSTPSPLSTSCVEQLQPYHYQTQGVVQISPRYSQ